MGKNRFAFDFLDVDKDGSIDILSMIQIYKCLPDRSLLKFELLLLLEEYKSKNITNSQAGFRVKQVNFGTFNMLIPQSCLLKSLQFTFFGHTFPITSFGSHMVKPPCPL